MKTGSVDYLVYGE